MQLRDWIIIALIFVSQVAHALKGETFAIRGKAVPFVEYSQRRLFSKNCLAGTTKGKSNKLNCGAARMVSQGDLGSLRFNSKAIAPGAAICLVQMQGRLLSGKNSQGREMSFCEMPDRSYVDIHTIAYYAQRKVR